MRKSPPGQAVLGSPSAARAWHGGHVARPDRNARSSSQLDQWPRCCARPSGVRPPGARPRRPYQLRPAVNALSARMGRREWHRSTMRPPAAWCRRRLGRAVLGHRHSRCSSVHQPLLGLTCPSDATDSRATRTQARSTVFARHANNPVWEQARA